MIKVDNVAVYNLEGAVRGMRAPYKSYDKSDSGVACVTDAEAEYCLGKADLDLMRKLFKAGPEHRKFMRQIMVCMDITAPDYWWMQFDAYKVGVSCDSESKMHTLLQRPFQLDDFSVEHVPGYRKVVEQKRPIITTEMENSEEWRDIGDDYKVSNYGRVMHGNKILHGSVHSGGYIFVWFGKKQVAVHQLVCKAFHPDTYQDGLCVNHIDGNKQNNFADNLEWVTQKDNIAHSRCNHLQPLPVNTFMGKLSEDDREEVHRLDSAGISRREIARRFGVTHTCICDMLNGKHLFKKKKNYFKEYMIPLVNYLNDLRDQYLVENDEDEKKKIWKSILSFTPLSYNQRRTVTMNYEVAASIVRQRRNHKLNEWNTFIDVLLEELPYLSQIMEG